MFQSWGHFLRCLALVISFDIACILVGWGIYSLVISFL